MNTLPKLFLAGILPICAYLSWMNDDLWPAAIVLMFSWCAFIVSWAVDYRRRNAGKK